MHSDVEHPEGIFVFFPQKKAKLGVTDLQPMSRTMEQRVTPHAILVVHEGLTPVARSVLEQEAARINIEVFKTKEMLIDITEHILVR